MEAGRAFGNRDDSRAPALSLGLTSVRLIVNKFESQHTRVVDRQLARYIDEAYDSPLERSRRQVISLYLSRWIPSVSLGNFGVLSVVIGLFAPKMLSYMVVYPFCRLVFGTLYPAYASYKAVRTKNLKEYVKWMMYWIVFALFTCTETITDVFLSWFPFYYEVKIVLVLWLLSPATKGSSILYRKFVHPALCRREQEIDEYIAKAKDQGYHTVLNLGTKGVNYATTVIMQTAIKGGGGLVQQIKKSYSLSDLTECDPREERSNDEADDVMTEPRLIRRVPKSGYPARRSASESASRSMYFPEVDVEVRPRPRSDEPDFSQIKSTEDISSGYSSADNSVSLTRTASLGARARRPARTQLTAIKRPQAAEGSDVIIEEARDDEFDYANMPSLVNLPAQLFMSQTHPPFLYQYIGDQVRIIQVLGEDHLVAKNKNVEKDLVNSVMSDEKEMYDDVEKDSKESGSKESLENLDVDKEHEKEVDTITTFVEEVNNTNIDLKEKSENNKESAIDLSVIKDVTECVTVVDKHVTNEMSGLEDVEDILTDKVDSNKTDSKDENTVKTNNENLLEVVASDKYVENVTEKQPDQETISFISVKEKTDNDSAESGDDEASFGTPENSPKSKRKLAKGKYGKGKAPPPPVVESTFPKEKIDLNMSDNTSQESLVDILNRLPNTAFKESGAHKKCLQVINPIAENKRRHKSKSPGNIQKGNTTTIGRLLQLPGKLAFWNKPDDTIKSKTDLSDADSRRSSNIDLGIVDEFQSCADLTNIIPLDVEKTDVIPATAVTHVIADDQISFKDAIFDSEDITQDIIDKSDALQKLIEAKIESHPEYKIVSLHAEIPTSSKSTDV